MLRDGKGATQLARELGKPDKRVEFQQRRAFAAEYPDIVNALTIGSWHAFCTRKKPRPEIGEPEPLPEGVFQVIYADPPWRYEQPGGRTPELRAVELHYPSMDDEEIAALEVPAADDAVCFLWATNPKLREALAVLESWSFEYRTNVVWVKDRIGMGYYVRGQHELLLIGKRGELPVPAEADRPPSVLNAPRGEHSAKPGAAYDLIERMYPDAKRLELFGRENRLGWTTWGAIAA